MNLPLNIDYSGKVVVVTGAGGQIVNVIPDEIIRDLAKLWGLTPLDGVLKV